MNVQQSSECPALSSPRPNVCPVRGVYDPGRLDGTRDATRRPDGHEPMSEQELLTCPEPECRRAWLTRHGQLDELLLHMQRSHRYTELNALIRLGRHESDA